MPIYITLNYQSRKQDCQSLHKSKYSAKLQKGSDNHFENISAFPTLYEIYSHDILNSNLIMLPIRLI